ncbi:MAG: hypothetical protein IJI11_01335 [Mogibacterium sp.]|nr:hypothetical protein [Mogibacterium sp.]
MGFFDDVKKAVNSLVPRKIEANRAITIEELYDLLLEHEDEFDMPFKLSSMFGKHITFKRHPQLEIQLLVSVKDNVITVRPNDQSGSIESDGFSIRTADLKNGFGLQTELNRDDYVQAVTDKIAAIVNG